MASPFSSQHSREKLSSKLNEILSRSVDSSQKNTAPGAIFGVTNDKETVFLEAKGYADITTRKQLTKDTLFGIYSCSKAITVTGILQLVEQGKLDLDAPVKIYLPEIEKFGVIKGFDRDNEPVLEKPLTDITMKMLLTHTAGFSYSFFNEDYLKILKKRGKPNIFSVTPDIMEHSYLLFEPGTKWSYGMNIDWAGAVLERITGQTLGDYLEENLFKPAKMDSFTFHLKDSNNLTKLHFRGSDGMELNSFQHQLDPPVDLGGSGIFGKIEDYLKFIRLWLNEGTSDNGTQILKPETCKFALENHLSDGFAITSLPGVESHITNHFSLDPNVPADSWSLPFALTAEELPTGRPKGSYYWCGIANLFYWFDTKNKIGGMWATQILPFLDPSLLYFNELETQVYDALKE